MNKIKVVGTIGSVTDSLEVIKNLILNGVDAIRIDMNMFTRKDAESLIYDVKTLNKKLDTNIGIIITIGMPTIRLGRIQGGEAYFKAGDKIRLYVTDELGDDTKASIDYQGLLNDVNKKDILIIDKNVKMTVFDIGKDCIICEVTKGGHIHDYDVVNINTRSNFLRIKDVKDIEFASNIGADYIELANVSTSDDVLLVTDMLISYQNDHTSVISRIETESAIDDIDSIIKTSDGVLIDRNKLSLVVPMERIPGLQRMIIGKCRRIGKISTVSVDIPLNTSEIPSRIEVQDIANASMDGVDAIILNDKIKIDSPYINSIKKIESILKEIELSIDYTGMFEEALRDENIDVTGMIASNVAATANKLKCKAIIAPTITGYTARKISRFRPCCPIIAVSPNYETVTALSLQFGINAVLIDDLNSLDKIIKISESITKGLVNTQKGDKIIITGGYPFKESKSTNFMKIEEL